MLKDTQGFSHGDIAERDRIGHYQNHRHQIIKRKSEQVNPTRLSTKDVAPLTEEECKIQDGIDDPAKCYTASTPGLLTCGVRLEVGDTVLARLPDKSGHGHSASAQQDQYATAIIRWTGLVAPIILCITSHT